MKVLVTHLFLYINPSVTSMNLGRTIMQILQTHALKFTGIN